MGSSPPTRGTLPGRIVGFFQSRIIPAYAGNTEPGQLADALSADHPRLRGEHPVEPVSVPSVGGSSPPTRGTQGHHPQLTHPIRIIPAYAGNTK